MNGKDIVMKFNFREDIDAAQSTCTQNHGSESCVFTKAFAHRFDRLTHGEDELGAHLSVDWTHWQDVGGPAEVILDAYDGVLPELDLDAFEAAREKHDVVVVDIDYPWCQSCG